MMTLAQLRDQHDKITQKQLATFLHVDRSAISKWESGKQVPDRDMAMRIAQFFDVPFIEIEKIFLKQKKQAENHPTWQHRQVAMDLADDRGGICHQ